MQDSGITIVELLDQRPSLHEHDILSAGANLILSQAEAKLQLHFEE